MKHFNCGFRVQHLNLHEDWHISFLLVAKSEILYIIVIYLTSDFTRSRGTLNHFERHLFQSVRWY
jgi:hypothetical protein